MGASSLSKDSLCVEVVSERRLDAAEEFVVVTCAGVIFGGEAMLLDDDADVDDFMGVGATGVGKGAARLVGLAKERNTALAFCLPAPASLSLISMSSLSASDFSDFLRFGGLGLTDSSASSCDLREELALEPFLEAMVLAFELGGPQ